MGLETQASQPRYRRHWGVSPKTRYQLGECDALVTAIRSTPIRPEQHRRLLGTALAKGALATTAIGGNLLSADEVAEVLASERQGRGEHHFVTEVRNVAGVARTLIDEAGSGGEAAVDADLLLRLHRGIGEGLGENFGATPGRLRSGDASATYSVPRADQVPGLVNDLFGWLDREFPRTGGADDFGSDAIRAVVTHVYVLWIRPFADGNGRVARMLESYILMSAGTPALASQILSCFYRETRREYLGQLELATGERSLTSFIAYAVEGLRDGLRETLDEVQRTHFESAWRGFVFDRFDDQPHRKRTVFRRRRDLMLAFPLQGRFELEEVGLLNAEIAHRYGGLSERTLRRDLAFLARIGLVTEEDGGFAANTAALRPR